MAVLLFFAGACAAPQAQVDPQPEAQSDPAPPEDVDPSRRAEGSEGRGFVLYRPHPDPIVLNEPFEVELRVFENGSSPRPIEGADVYVSGWMPDHLHGMVLQPETTELGGGIYRARGLLFHMPGHWQIFVDVVVGRKPERATFEIRL